jgi:hypothetical protein
MKEEIESVRMLVLLPKTSQEHTITGFQRKEDWKKSYFTVHSVNDTALYCTQCGTYMDAVSSNDRVSSPKKTRFTIRARNYKNYTAIGGRSALNLRAEAGGVTI